MNEVADPASDCPVCGGWRDAPTSDCAACAYVPEEHVASEDADQGGAMDATCLDCGAAIWRQSYGSFVGPWVLRAAAGEVKP